MDIENDFLFRWYERQLLVEGMTKSFLLRLAKEAFGHLWGATEELTAELLIRSGLSGITRDFPRHRILPFYSPLIYRQKETIEFREGDGFRIEEDREMKVVSFPHTLSIIFSPVIAGKVFSWFMNGSKDISPICDLPLGLQRASRKGRVMVVGAGGLGCPLIETLLDNGIDDICIIEPGEIKLNNLHRQILYDYGDIGLSKASVIEKKVSQRYSGVRVKIHKESFDPAFIKTEKPDIIVSCVDNYEARYLINDSCYRNCVPFVDSAVENFGGYAVFRDRRMSCYRCFMGDNRRDTRAPKGILPFVSYFGGMLEAAMVLTFLNTGRCGDDVFWFDLRKGKFESISVERREGCPVCSSAKR